MKKEQIAALLSLGFTFEDLYNKGILVPAGDQTLASPAAPSAVTDPDPTAPAAVTDPAPSSGNEELVNAINGMKNDIIKAVQQINIAGAERGGNNKTMTVEDALDGIVKGV